MAIKKTRTMCTTCHARCGVIVHSDENNQIIKIEGDPNNKKSRGVICGSGMSQREIHNNLEGRLLYPMKRVDWDPNGDRHPENRGKSEFERISWDEALDIIAAETIRIRDEYGPEAIITGQGTGRVANHWHCRLNSSIGLEGWSLVPTHVCASCPISFRMLLLSGFQFGGRRYAQYALCSPLGSKPCYGDRMV